jgi:uncharacterized protein RhaS with RHS repeats
MYDPRAGRFLSEDPLGLADGVNVYAYAQNDPVNGVDPTGLQRQTASLNFVVSGQDPFISTDFDAQGWTSPEFHREIDDRIAFFNQNGYFPLRGPVINDPYTLEREFQERLGKAGTFEAGFLMFSRELTRSMTGENRIEELETPNQRLWRDRGENMMGASHLVLAMAGSVGSRPTTGDIIRMNVNQSQAGRTSSGFTTYIEREAQVLSELANRPKSAPAPTSSSAPATTAGSRPGVVMNNPANRLVETGVPNKSGGWQKKWTRMTAEDVVAQQIAIHKHYQKVQLEASKLAYEQRHQFRFEKMREFRVQQRENFLKNRTY